MARNREKWSEELEWRGWAIPNVLAVTSRPGYPEPYVSSETVAAWIQEVKAKRFRSIICLLNTELGYYADIKQGGLLQAYRKAGFEVFQFPVPDTPLVPVPEAVLKEIERRFPEMPKPVLVHCSAGIDRSGDVLERLLSSFGG